MPENVDTTIIRLVDDKASRQQVVRGLDSVIDKIERVANPLGKLGTAAAGGVRRLRSEFQDGEEEVDRFAAKTESLLEKIERLNRAEATPTINMQGRGGQGGLQTIDVTGRIGTQIASGLGAGELGNAIGLVGDLAGSVKDLGVAGGVAGIAIAAVTIALGEYNRGLDEQKRRLDAALDGQEVYYRAVEELTSQEAQEEIDRRTRDNARLQQQIDETQGAIDSAWQQAVATFGDAGARALEALGQSPTAPLKKQLAELQGQFALNEIAATRLTQGLENNAFVLNDRAAREEEIAEISERVNEQSEEYLAHRREELELTRRQNAENITRQYDAQLDTLESLGKAQESVNQAQQAYNDSLSQQSAKIAEVNDKLTEQLASAETTRLDALNKAERDAGDARLRALRNFQEAERKINAQYANDKLMAEGNRDALAAFQAKLAKEEQLQDQEHQLSEQEQEIEQSLRKQTQTIEDQYAKQVSTAQSNASKQIALVQQQGQTELALRQQTLSAAIVQLQNFQNAAIAIMNQLVTSTANMRYGANYGTPTTVTLPNGQTQPGYAVQYGMVNGRYQPIPAPQSSGGATLNLTVNGATQQMVNNASFQQATQVVNGAIRQIYGQSAPR